MFLNFKKYNCITLLLCSFFITLFFFYSKGFTSASEENIHFINSGYETFFSGTDMKNHPGFQFVIPSGDNISYLKIEVDGVKQEIELDESNFLNDDTEIRIRSLYDTDFEFTITEDAQTKVVKVESYNTRNELISSGSFEFTVPIQGKILNLQFNNQKYSENMIVKSPLTVDVFFNKKIRDNTLLNNLVLMCNNEKLDYSISQLEDGHVQIQLNDGLPSEQKLILKVGKNLNDIDRLPIVEDDKIYTVNTEAVEAKPLLLETVYLDGDTSKVLTDSFTEYKNPQTVTFVFNQTIQTSSFIPSTVDGANSQGIYLQELEKEDSNARIIEPEFKTLEDSGNVKSLVTFKLVGKEGYFTHEPLPSNSKFELIVDTNLKSNTGTNLESPYIVRFATSETTAKTYELGVFNGEKYDNFDVYLENELVQAPYAFNEGAVITLRAKEIAGKQFDSWDFGNYYPENFPDEYNQLQPLLKNKEITFKMPKSDFSLGAIYKQTSTVETPKLEDMVINEYKLIEQVDANGKLSPGFNIKIRYNGFSQYYVLNIDNNEYRVNFDENNIVDDGDSINLNSFNDMSVKFNYTSEKQDINVKIVGYGRDNEPIEEASFTLSIPAKTNTTSSNNTEPTEYTDPTETTVLSEPTEPTENTNTTNTTNSTDPTKVNNPSSENSNTTTITTTSIEKTTIAQTTTDKNSETTSEKIVPSATKLTSPTTITKLSGNKKSNSPKLTRTGENLPTHMALISLIIAICAVSLRTYAKKEDLD